MSVSEKGNMLIAQSGGPSMVINQSLVGAIQEAKKQSNIKKIYGSLHGIKGILEETTGQQRNRRYRYTPYLNLFRAKSEDQETQETPAPAEPFD